MQTIVIAGLVSVEKHELALDLARYYSTQGHSVALVDNIARLRLPDDQLPADVALQRIEGTLTAAAITLLDADMVIIAASEMAEPESLFTALLDLPNVQILALIDTRTCDCFPNVRESLELHVDAVLNLPISYQDLLEVVA